MNKNNKGKNILCMCHYSSIYSGNFIYSLLCLENALYKKNRKLIYVFPYAAENREWYKNLQKSNKIVYLIEPNMKCLKQLNKIIHKHQVKIIYTHFSRYDSIAAVYRILYPGIKVIFHNHSDFSGVLKSQSFGDRMKNIAKKVLYTNIPEILVSNHLIIENKIRDLVTFVPNAIAFERIEKSQHTYETARQTLGIDNEQIFILMFGWHYDIKGVDIAVQAVNSIIEKFPTVLLGIVVGENGELETREKIKNTTTNSGEEKWIRYFKPSEDVFLYHRAADIFLSASRSEGFSYSILESLSIGNIIVNSNLPGTSWAKEFDLTVNFDYLDVSQCSMAIIDGINKRNSISKEEKEKIVSKVKDKYDINQWCKRIITVIDEI